MARFSKFKLLFALKSNFNEINFLKKYENLVIKKVEKSHNIIAVAKICQGNELG